MDEQLSLPLPDPGAKEVPTPPARLAFPVATDGGRAFDDDARFFEPWWPGAQAFMRRVGDLVEIQTEHLSDPLLAFPRLRDAAERLEADGVIVEGTLLALDSEGRPDARLLRRALSGAASDELADGAFVASDLPWLEGRPQARQPFATRRSRLASILPDSDWCVLGRGLVGEGVTLARASVSLGLAAVSARRLDGHWRPGPRGDDWLRLRVGETPAVPTRPFLVLLEKLPFGEPGSG